MKTITLKDRLKKAFTITELVIVIAVIAILAAILIPSFSKVTESANKSHDEQIVKSINTALNSYTLENGHAPADYKELMTALKQYDLTDDANMFLLAGSLKQDKGDIIWLPHSNRVELYIEGVNATKMIPTDALPGGNGVYIHVDDKTTAMLGYKLCINGRDNGVANIQKAVHGGGIDFGNTEEFNAFIEQNVTGKVSNAAWAETITSSLKNQKEGYVYQNSVENKVLTQLAATTSAVIDVNAIEVPDYVKQGDDEQNTKAKAYAIKSSLATLATMQNTGTTSAKLGGKKVVFNDCEGVEVDMTNVVPTAIGILNRKNDVVKKNTTSSTVSVDFGGMKLKNFAVRNDQFVSAGAEYQKEGDNGFPGGSYSFTYGLFGTVVANPGETVTISNIDIDGVSIDLNGATETINGEKVKTVADQAGIIAGYTQGNVVFKDININGQQANGERGSITGYDSVAAIVGRSYTNPSNLYKESISFERVNVSNLNVYGARRAAIYYGYANRMDVYMKDCNATNVLIEGKREDGNNEIWIGLLGFSQDYYTHGGSKYCKLEVDNVNLDNVESKVQFRTPKAKEAGKPYLDIDQIIAKQSTENGIAELQEFYTGYNARPYTLAAYDYFHDNVTGKNFYLLNKLQYNAKIDIVGGGLTIKIGQNKYSLSPGAIGSENKLTGVLV